MKMGKHLLSTQLFQNCQTKTANHMPGNTSLCHKKHTINPYFISFYFIVAHGPLGRGDS